MTLFDGKDQSVEPTLDTVKAKFTKEDGTIDVDGLLNKALHADKHIPTIEGENANLRKEVDSRLNYQDLLDKLESYRVQSASRSNPDPDGDERDEGKPTITEDRISAMLDEKLTRKQQEALQASNVQYAKRELATALGTDWVQKLAKMAPDLDMTQQEIEYLAATKPKALLRMVVPQAQETSVSSGSFVPPVSRINTSAVVSSTEKKNSHYQERLRKDPKLAGDPQFVAEQMAQARKLGEAFFN